MRICIDTRWIFKELTGIGLYSQELVRALSRIDRENEYLLLFDNAVTQLRTIETARLADTPNFSCRSVPQGPLAIGNQFGLPAFLRANRIDLYHSTNYMMPLLSGGGARRVVTIHDLIPLLFRDHAPRARKARLFPVFKRLMREVGRRADRVITVSESTRADVMRELRVEADRISVTLEGVTPDHLPADRKPRAEKVVLFVGRRDPYKNLPLLIEAFAALPPERAARLRIVGPPDDRYPEAPRRARELGLDGRIEWIGYASPSDLVEFYQQADAFVLPSRYEGFGLTVLEAMACGTPVVCSNVSSLPEVAGDAGLLVPPNDAPALTAALDRILSDDELAADLRRRGLNRAALFTWEKTARETLSAYEKTMRAGTRA